MATKQTAWVTRMTLVHESWGSGKLLGQTYDKEIVYMTDDLMKAKDYADFHQKELGSGDRFDIYFRREEDGAYQLQQGVIICHTFDDWIRHIDKLE